MYNTFKITINIKQIFHYIIVLYFYINVPFLKHLDASFIVERYGFHCNAFNVGIYVLQSDTNVGFTDSNSGFLRAIIPRSLYSSSQPLRYATGLTSHHIILAPLLTPKLAGFKQKYVNILKFINLLCEM